MGAFRGSVITFNEIYILPSTADFSEENGDKKKEHCLPWPGTGRRRKSLKSCLSYSPRQLISATVSWVGLSIISAGCLFLLDKDVPSDSSVHFVPGSCSLTITSLVLFFIAHVNIQNHFFFFPSFFYLSFSCSFFLVSLLVPCCPGSGVPSGLHYFCYLQGCLVDNRCDTYWVNEAIVSYMVAQFEIAIIKMCLVRKVRAIAQPGRPKSLRNPEGQNSGVLLWFRHWASGDLELSKCG